MLLEINQKNVDDFVSGNTAFSTKTQTERVLLHITGDIIIQLKDLKSQMTINGTIYKKEMQYNKIALKKADEQAIKDFFKTETGIEFA